MAEEKKTNKQTAKISTAAGILIVTVILLAVNILATVVVNRFSLEIDMTTSGLYKISQESVDAMKQVGREVNIYVICESRDSVREYSEMLDKYELASPYVHVTYVNPYSSQSFIDQLKAEGYEVGLNNIVVECEGRRRIFGLTDLYTFNADQTEVVYFDGEAKLTSAILTLSSGQASVIGATMGHGEEMPAQLQNQLMVGGYELGQVLLSSAPPEEIKLMLILGPTKDFTESEIAVLDDFLKKGGALAVFLDPTSGELPVLRDFLAEWEIEFRDDVVLDSVYNVDTNPSDPITFYSEHAITQYFMSHQYYTVASSCRSLEGDFSGYYGDLTIEAVLISSDYAYGRSVENLSDATEKTDQDAAGPFLLAMTSTAPTGGKIFAMGSTRLYSDEMLTRSSVGNAQFMSEVLRWGDGGTGGVQVNIPPKQIGAQDIAIPTRTAYIFGAIFVILIPAVLVILGIRMYLKRRHL